MESMTNAPYLLPKARAGLRMGHAQVIDHMFSDGLEDAYDRTWRRNEHIGKIVLKVAA
jgi:acetyl-CoA C-acetyltransferase